MIVWTSPFSGDLFVGGGTITDINTQNDLANFVQSGGRLFISGQDIAFALAGNGQANNFFSGILKAQFISDNFGLTDGLTGGGTTINNLYTGQLAHDPFDPATANHAYGKWTGGTPDPTYVAPDQGGPGANGTLRYVNYDPNPANVIIDASRTAASLGGYIDVVAPVPTANSGGVLPDSVDVYHYAAGNSAIIASAVPATASPVGPAAAYDQTKPFVPVGKVAYSAAGFESVGLGWYTYTPMGGALERKPLGRRAEVMHNITCSFRTATLTGQVIDQDGRPVNDSLVRAILNVADDTQVAAGTALTDDSGNFQIVGLQPGFYVLFGYKAGFYTQHNTGNTVHGAWRSAAQLALKRAGPGSLTGVKNAATNGQGGVFNSDGTQSLGGIEIQLIRKEASGRLTLVSTTSANPQQQLPTGAYNFPSLLIANYAVLVNSTLTVDPANPMQLKRITSGANAPTVDPRYGEVILGLSPDNQIRVGPNTVILPGDSTAALLFDQLKKLKISEGITSSLDFLLPAKPQKVSGRVLDQDSGQGIKGAIVTAAKSTDPNTVVATATTDDNGNYTLTASTPVDPTDPTLLPGGTYIVTANANGYSTAVPPSAANAVQVVVGGSTDPVVTAPDIKLKKLPPGSVSGLVSRFIGSGKPTTSGVDGATVTFYAVTTVGGQQVQAPDPSYSVTVSTTPTTTPDGYTFNYSIASVNPGTYNAYVAKAGLTGDPSPFANITVTSGQETRNVNFTLEPPKIYGAGVQLASVPQDFSAVQPTALVFGLTPTGDNDGNGTSGDANDVAIYNAFNIADWTGQQYNISPTIPLRLGKGYFINFGAVAAVATSGTPLTTSSFSINLATGWNLIGHPFSNQTSPADPAADIDLSSPQLASFTYTINGTTKSGVPLSQAVADSAVGGVAWSYTGSNAGSNYIQGTLIKPWFGYWFQAFVPVQLTLQYPGAGSRALKAPVQSGGKFQSVTRAMRDTIVPRSIDSKGPTNWRIQLAARQGDLVDTDNSIGVAPDAHDGFDNKYDNQKPPMVTEASALYVAVKGTDAAGRAASFSDSITTPGGGLKTWEFTVQTTGTGNVTLYWPNINRLPRGVEPILVDEATGKRVAMRSGSSSYQFAPTGRAEHAFRVEVAPPTSMPLDILNLRTDSRGIGGSYRFSFTVTRAVDVNAEIKTLTGRSMRQFQTRAASGSQTAIVWDGRDQAGNRVPPGPYLLSITARDANGAQVSRSVTVMALQ
jgi:protocatechuate 3,4-dioxygenase beta subunit